MATTLQKFAVSITGSLLLLVSPVSNAGGLSITIDYSNFGYRNHSGYLPYSYKSFSHPRTIYYSPLRPYYSKRGYPYYKYKYQRPDYYNHKHYYFDKHRKHYSDNYRYPGVRKYYNKDNRLYPYPDKKRSRDYFRYKESRRDYRYR